MLTFFSSRLLLAAGLLAGAAACSGPAPAANPAPTGQITDNDFEALDGWGTPVPSLTTEQAHSGRFAIKVDAGQEYGFSYVNTLGRASTSRIQKLGVSGWVMRAGADGTATLVIEIKDPAQDYKQLFWRSISLADEVKEVRQWQPFKQEFALPAGFSADKELRVYMWRNNAGQPTYLDDLTLTRVQ